MNKLVHFGSKRVTNSREKSFFIKGTSLATSPNCKIVSIDNKSSLICAMLAIVFLLFYL